MEIEVAGSLHDALAFTPPLSIHHTVDAPLLRATSAALWIAAIPLKKFLGSYGLVLGLEGGALRGLRVECRGFVGGVEKGVFGEDGAGVVVKDVEVVHLRPLRPASPAQKLLEFTVKGVFLGDVGAAREGVEVVEGSVGSARRHNTFTRTSSTFWRLLVDFSPLEGICGQGCFLGGRAPGEVFEDWGTVWGGISHF